MNAAAWTDSEALARHKAIVEYESSYKDFTSKYERMYGPLSDEERLGWRRLRGTRPGRRFTARCRTLDNSGSLMDAVTKEGGAPTSRARV